MSMSSPLACAIDTAAMDQDIPPQNDKSSENVNTLLHVPGAGRSQPLQMSTSSACAADPAAMDQDLPQINESPVCCQCVGASSNNVKHFAVCFPADAHKHHR